MKLEGIRVLDLSQFLPGPHLTMTMADHGADVIMVEPKNGVGEPVRAMGARMADGTAVWFRNIARGKRSITLDLKDAGDKQKLLDLAKEADVIVEAFRPGVVKRLGIDYAAISAGNPRVVYCSISAFGQERTLSRQAFRTIWVCRRSQARSIFRAASRTTGQTCPISSPPTWASSLTALSAILMALLARGENRQGRLYRHRDV